MRIRWHNSPHGRGYGRYTGRVKFNRGHTDGVEMILTGTGQVHGGGFVVVLTLSDGRRLIRQGRGFKGSAKTRVRALEALHQLIAGVIISDTLSPD